RRCFRITWPIPSAGQSIASSDSSVTVLSATSTDATPGKARRSPASGETAAAEAESEKKADSFGTSGRSTVNLQRSPVVEGSPRIWISSLIQVEYSRDMKPAFFGGRQREHELY